MGRFGISQNYKYKFNFAVLVCFWHFPVPMSSLVRQFCDHYFPTHYTSVTLGLGAYFVS
uniref:Uncharacterized protein n=1 Tax=Helianthus annuus TaxID=4232 RepID=A0A251RX76_HELAN